MNLQQIGRNYYNPSDPIDIPNHRFVYEVESFCYSGLITDFESAALFQNDQIYCGCSWYPSHYVNT